MSFGLSNTNSASLKGTRDLHSSHQPQHTAITLSLSKLAFFAILAIGQVTAVGVRFHSLGSCKTSPIDVGCRNLALNTCCSSKGLNARSVTFAIAKGRSLTTYGGEGTPSTLQPPCTLIRAKGKNTCVAGRGTPLHGASFKNPLKKKYLDAPCEATQEADVAFINGDEAVLSMANMTGAEKSDMYELANAGTAVATWPESLKQYLVDDVEAE